MLVDRYRLVSRIATGGMGEVWEAVDDRLDRRVAVKVLKPEISADPEFLGRFRVEARTAAGLNHPGVAGVYDYGETRSLEPGDQTTAFLVMELVEGEPLSAVLAREGRIETDLTLDVLEQTGRALQAAHARGVVHRDVKPGNILVTPDGRVKITDFGIAKAVDAAPVTRTGMVMGTAQYIAPEQALGQEAGPPSDVYALAVVGYECLAGRRPFTGDNALAVAMMHISDTAPPLPSDVPRPVAELLRTAMVKDPDQRYRNGGELADAVSAVRGGRRLPRPTGWVGAVQNPAPTRAMTAAAGTGATARQVPARVVPPANRADRPPATRVDRPPATRARSSAATGWLVFGGVLLVGLLVLAGYLLITRSGTTNRPSTPPSTSATVTTGPTTSTAPTATTAPTITTTTAPTTDAPTTTAAPTTTTTAPTTDAPTTTGAPTTSAAPTTTGAPITTPVPTSGAGTS